jgi:hypothetical protein
MKYGNGISKSKGHRAVPGDYQGGRKKSRKKGGMMEKRQRLMLLIIVFSLVLLAFADHESKAQMGQERVVRKMNITGEIAKAAHGYIIRGKTPAEIFTILNPDPTILDEFVKSGRIFDIEVRIVSGDNVEIEKIGGKKYP